MQSEQTVINNPQKRQFEIQLGEELGLLAYRQRPGQIELMHTEVPINQRRKGIGDKLVQFALEFARQNQLEVVPTCRFVQAYLKRHPDALTAS
jgi:predicted GNAT family acetyltransferase